MRFRDWLAVAAALMLIGLAYGHAQHQDDESACRDEAALYGKRDK